MKKEIKYRKSIRLPDYDYSQSGAYFITICTRERLCIFGDITNGEMQLYESGKIVWNIWQSLPPRYPQINLGPAVVMPNHFHGVIEITDSIGMSDSVGTPDSIGTSDSVGTPDSVAAIHELPLQNQASFHNQESSQPNTPIQRRKMLLPKIMGYFKMNSAKAINQLLNTPGSPVWQRGYYERIIRDEREYERITRYIEINPLNWVLDEEYRGN